MKVTASDNYSTLELKIYIVGWSIIFCFPMMMQTYDVMSGELSEFRWDMVLMNMQPLLPILLLFLLNNYVLLPRLFLQRHKLWYLLAILGILIVMWYAQVPPSHHDHAPMPPHPGPGHLRPGPPAPFDMFKVTNLIIAICILLANFGVKLYIQSLRRNLQIVKIEKEKMQQELQSLKYQISPHFLMNTLNNIQSLIESNPVTAYRTIQQLSKMMRYLLYENNTQQVPLSKEVDFMRNYIDLMKLRYPSSVKICAELPEYDHSISVPPFLFITFIENAFKHGISYTEESMISVKLNIEGNKLSFYCANFTSNVEEDGSKQGGLGIKNVKRRLDLIYGNDYELELSKQNGMYIVEMVIPISRTENN